MPTTNKKSQTKSAARNDSANIILKTWRQIFDSRAIASARARAHDFLGRRPHRSFRRTYRRDYARSLNIPGYITFTHYVNMTLWKNKKVFLYMVLVYAILTIAITNLSSEDLYAQMRETVNESNADIFRGAWGEIGKAGLLLVGGISGAYNGSAVGASAQIYATILGLLAWLTTVWLLRAILAGRKPKMRDGLYGAGAPIISTFFVASLIVLQMLPLALALFGYSSAVSSGLLEGGVESMMFWSVAALLAILSLYWITTTLIALVVVTLPGMYPMQAIRTAGDLVVGRRLRILLRLIWMLLTLALTWVIIVIPIILFDGWLKSVWQAVSWMPIVPVTLLVMGSITIVWIASYVYLFYRKVVEDDALPA